MTLKKAANTPHALIKLLLFVDVKLCLVESEVMFWFNFYFKQYLGISLLCAFRLEFPALKEDSAKAIYTEVAIKHQTWHIIMQIYQTCQII